MILENLKVNELKQPIIEMKHVSYSYDHRNVIEDINLQIEEGDFSRPGWSKRIGKDDIAEMHFGAD